MKKIGLVILVLALLVGTVGCTTSKKDFQVGFGKQDITPEEGVGLGGYGNTAQRLNTGELSPLYALATVITDAEDNTLVLVVTDLSFGYYTQTQQVRAAISSKYEIPKENIMLAGTHNHNAPDPSSSNSKNVEYMKTWLQAVEKAVDQAMEDRKPATMEIGRTETENLVFSRRYVREDGNYVGGGPASYNVESNAPIVGHESEADEEIQMVRFVREEGKDIIITNWQSHACNIDGNRDKSPHYMASGEWPEVMRSYVEQELDVHCIYFQGAAGNLGCRSSIEGEFALDDTKNYQAIGETLAQYVIDACNETDVFQKVETGLIQVNQYKMAINKSDGTPAKQDKDKPELNTISIGDVSIVTFPFEFFDYSAKWLKERTPYDMTLFLGYANGSAGYMAPEEFWDHGSYEVLNSHYERGSAEKAMTHFLDTLEDMREAK